MIRVDPITTAMLVGLAAIGAVAHLCLKAGAQKRRPGSFWSFFFQPWIVAGVALTGLNAIAVSAIMRFLPLTVVMPLTSLIYIFVPIGAMLVFKEKVKPKFWGGGILILIGIVILNS